MSDKQKTTPKDGGRTLGVAVESEQNNQNSPLFKREQIGESPLVIVGDDEQGYAVAIGQYKITETQKSLTDAYEQLQGEAKWNTICKLITTIVEIAKQHEEANKPIHGEMPKEQLTLNLDGGQGIADRE